MTWGKSLHLSDPPCLATLNGGVDTCLVGLLGGVTEV